MFYTNMTSILAMCGMIAVLMLTRRWAGNKRVLLLLFNAAFLLVYSQKLFVFYMAWTALNFIGFRFLCVVPKWRKGWFLSAIAANVAAVSCLRLFEMDVWTNSLFDAVLFLGVIYNVLKVIDAYYFAYYVGKDGRAGAMDYFNFILFIPTFTSGPILKFRDFMADTRKPYQVDAAAFESGIKRIILGLFKKFVIVAWMSRIFYDVMDGAGTLQTHESLFLMVWFYIWIYFDFSGYSDIAIGFGRLMGYNIPENFKKPFTAPTLTQYWRNWHATMADWFRDHVFLIFGRQTPSKWAGAAMSFGIMVLIGLWHGFNWLFVLWGVYHGIVIAIESLLGQTTVNKKKVSRSYFYFRCFVTQAIVVFAVIVYSYSPATGYETVLKIYRGLFTLPSF